MSPPAFLGLEPPLEREAVLRCLDYPADREPSGRVAALLDEVLDEARALLAARGGWCPLALDRCAEIGLSALPARGLALGLVTVGPALEARVTALQAGGALTRALILDACGSAAAEEAADLLSAHLLGELGMVLDPGAPAGTPGCRLSPGYRGWGLGNQPALLAMLGADRIGVSLSPGLMMQPRKSISFAMWLGATQRPVAGLAGCRACGLRRCRYLRAPGPS